MLPTRRCDSTWSSFYVVRDNGFRGIAASTLGLTKHFVAGLTSRRLVLVVVAAAAATVLSARRRPVLTGILWCPVVLLYFASFARRAPFGGGRTDIFLYPLAAVLAALAADEMFRIFRSRWSAKPWQGYASVLAAAAVVAVILKGARPAYPNHREEDLKPLARSVLEQRRQGDMVLVYPWARFAWFLYSEQPFSIPSRKKRPLGAPYTMEAKGTVVLDEHPEDGSAYASEIDCAIGADRIWLVASHLGYLSSETKETETRKIQAHIQNSGYRLQGREERPGAFIELWIRSVQEN